MSPEKQLRPESEDLQDPLCFVLMPISDPEGYEKGHFKRVYEDIFRPACEIAGFKSIRSDEVREANLIHLDILQKIIDSPIALCDLSSRNPNALFELGLRQAFDKPVVLIQEVGTPQIFDIAPLRYVEYRPRLDFREVLEDQKSIADALRATYKASLETGSINSIVRLLSLTHPAVLPIIKYDKDSELLRIVLAAIQNLKSELSASRRSPEFGSNADKLDNTNKVDPSLRSLNKEIHAINVAMERFNTGGLSLTHIQEWIDDLRSRLNMLANSKEAQTEVTLLKLKNLEENLQMIEKLYPKRSKHSEQEADN